MERKIGIEKIISYGLLAILYLAIIAFLDKTLAVGIIFFAFLIGLTFLVLNRLGFIERSLLFLFFISLLVHFLAVLFVYYTHFQPFGDGGGDFITYHLIAQEIARRVHQGNFSLAGIKISHYYPVMIGYLYVFTVPNMLIGQLFNAWLVTLSTLLAYLISFKITVLRKGAFLVGLIVSFYPSFLFFGSLMLKDALVVFLALTGLLLTLSLLKKFSWQTFLIFYGILLALVHFRFYLGYSLIFAFLVSWLFCGLFALKKRILYSLVFIFLFGFLPQIGAQQGYGGIKSFQDFLNPQTITYYREKVYALPSPEVVSLSPEIEKHLAVGSTEIIETGFDNPFKFLVNTLISFLNTALGPFPWQMKYPRHFLVLFETIPWYFLIFFILRGTIKSSRNYKTWLPLTLFSLCVLGVLSLYINNFGIITRIRIPAFIALLCLLPLGLVSNNFFYKIYEKVFHWWDSYRFRQLKLRFTSIRSYQCSESKSLGYW